MAGAGADAETKDIIIGNTLADERRGFYDIRYYHSLLAVSGKNFSLASPLRICTAKSPASSMAQPSLTFRFELCGTVRGGLPVRSWLEFINENYGEMCSRDIPLFVRA